MTCKTDICPDCKQPTLHLEGRGIHQSSSRFGQDIHDLCPRKITFTDIDGAVYRRSINLLRIIEHKTQGMTLGHAQLELLQKLASCIGLMKDLHQASGVFVVWSNSTGDSFEIVRLGESNKNVVLNRLDMFCWVGLWDGEDREYIKRNLV